MAGAYSTDCTAGAWSSPGDAAEACAAAYAANDARTAWLYTSPVVVNDSTLTSSIYNPIDPRGGAFTITCTPDSSGAGCGADSSQLLSMEDAGLYGFAFGSLLLVAWSFKMLARALGTGDMGGRAAISEREE